MPVWMEVLLNVIGYAGFIGIAMFNHASDETTAGEPRPGRGVSVPSAPGRRCARACRP